LNKLKGQNIGNKRKSNTTIMTTTLYDIINKAYKAYAQKKSTWEFNEDDSNSLFEHILFLAQGEIFNIKDLTLEQRLKLREELTFIDELILLSTRHLDDKTMEDKYIKNIN